ncbi:MAG: BlaI/MecI/CopY family transcriptional regulator [Planctomycetota bacterium]|jgi:predicted transcriptional regulator
MKLTEAEWQIMNALWANSPATARQIADRLAGKVDWAYTTIKTMLTRLSDKKAVEESKKGNMSVYEPILTRQAARRSALKGLANQAFDGAFGPLMHFLLEDQKVSDSQKQELLKALEQTEGGRKKEQKNDECN